MILFLFKILARSFDDFFLFFLLVGMGWPHYSNSWIPLSYSFYWTLVVWCVHFLRVPTQWHPLKPRNTTFMRQLLLVFKKRSQYMHPFSFTLLPPLSPLSSLPHLSFLDDLWTIYELQLKQSAIEQNRGRNFEMENF